MKGGRVHLNVLMYVLCALTAAQLSGASSAIFHALTDARFRWFPRDATGDVVLVAIDPQSITKVGVWPWPRTLHADLIKKLENAGATDIVLDIDFSSRQAEAADQALLDALDHAHGSVILPSFMQDVRGATGKIVNVITRPLAEFRKKSWPATANVVTETDGLVRRYSRGMVLDGEFVPSIGALLAGNYDPNGGDFFLDFGIRADTVPVISYADVLDGTAAVDKIRSKKIIVGATAIELGDRIGVPNGSVIPGPMLQALSAESLMQGRALARTSTAVTLAGLTVLAALVLMLWRRQTGSLTRVFHLVAFAVVAEVGAAVLQSSWGVLLDTSLWHVAVAAYITAIGFEELDLRVLMAKIAESRFRHVAVSLSEGLVCTDSTGIITFSNPSATNIFGYDAEEMRGRPFTSLLVPIASPASSSNYALLSSSVERAAGRTLELQGRRRSGEVFPLEASMSCWNHTEAIHYGWVIRDISIRKREEERIRFLAEHDYLTGLANRLKINDELALALSEAKATGRQVAVILLGLDRFKEINDTLGQDRGDKVICAIAERLRDQLEPYGFVARISGDEFAVVLLPSDDKPAASDAIDSVAREFAEICINLDDRLLTVALSLGSAIFPQDGETPNELMANAALALQNAKLFHRGTQVSYRSELRAKIEACRRLEKELMRAFVREEFTLFFQPQVDLKTRKVVGAEALIRWHHPERGLISPAEFLPVLDTMPLSRHVGCWVINTACRQAGDWHRAGHDIRIGINLAPSLFHTQDLPLIVAGALKAAAVPSGLIELEVTEGIVFEDNEKTAAILREIHQVGVAIAFDDFGTGHASLTHLKRFPLDRLKIDQSFVRDLTRHQDDGAIVSTLVGLGKLLSLQVTAEGIEDAETADALMLMGCGEGQGYHFGRPVSARDFAGKHLSGIGADLRLAAAPGEIAPAA